MQRCYSSGGRGGEWEVHSRLTVLSAPLPLFLFWFFFLSVIERGSLSNINVVMLPFILAF